MGEEQTSRGEESVQDDLPSSTSPRSGPSGPPLSTWSIDGRSYDLFTLSLTAADPKDEPAPISCLINPLLIPFLPSPLPSRQQPPKDPSFAILPTPNKGTGMFARRSIPDGELIVVEHPALIIPSGQFPDATYEALGAALPEKRRQEMVNMADCRGREECPTVVQGVVRTNALVLELDPEGRLGEGEIYGAVYPCINRSNHSCGPNAAVKWDLATLSLSLYALRDIKEGEEVLMSYVNPILSRASRTRTLKTNYRFTCDCPWCDIRQDGYTSQEAFTSAELARIKESDTRREQLGTWIFTHLSYKKWSTDLCRADDLLIKAHKEALVLIEIENVYALQNLFIEEIAMAHATLGDVDEFRKWGARLVQLCRVEDPKLAKKFDGWLVDPEKRVKKWGWRRKQRELMRKGRRNVVEPPLEDGLFLDLFQVEDD